MTIEQKLLALMEGKKEKSTEDSKEQVDQIDQEPAVKIDNPLDPDLENPDNSEQAVAPEKEDKSEEDEAEEKKEKKIEECSYSSSDKVGGDSFTHGDWTVTLHAKEGNNGASIVARHKDGDAKLNLFSGSKTHADSFFNHPSHLKKTVDILSGKIQEEVDEKTLKRFRSRLNDRDRAIEDHKKNMKSLRQLVPLSGIVHENDTYINDTNQLEVGKNYSYAEHPLNPKSFKVIGKRADGTVSIHHTLPSSEQSVVIADEDKFDITSDFLKNKKVLKMSEEVEELSEEFQGHFYDRMASMRSKMVYPNPEYHTTSSGKPILIHSPAKFTGKYIEDPEKLEVGHVYSYYNQDNFEPKSFRVIGKRSDGTVSIHHVLPSHQNFIVDGSESKFDIDKDFLQGKKVIKLSKSLVEELSEEFQAQAAALFEEKVQAKAEELIEEKLDTKVSVLKEEFETLFEEHKTKYETELVEKIDEYFDQLSEQWMKDNELALEAGLRSEMTESFMNGLKNLFESHYIEIPLEKVDVVNSLEEQKAELEEKLSDTQRILEENKKELLKTKREIILENTTKSMTEIDSGKFRIIMEEFQIEDIEAFEAKANSVKETFFGANKKEINLSEAKLNMSSKPLVEEKVIEAKPSVESKVTKYAQEIRKFQRATK